MKPIYLVGFMGSGKSTVGKALSNTFGVTYVDTDEYIEHKYKQSIPDIFKEYGEGVFRQYEQDVIQEVSTYEIVATGGGVVENKDNIKIMKTYGYIVYLKTSFEEIAKRLEHDKSRPLWKGSDEEEKLSLFNRREKLYRG